MSGGGDRQYGSIGELANVVRNELLKVVASGIMGGRRGETERKILGSSVADVGGKGDPRLPRFPDNVDSTRLDSTLPV